MSEFEIRPISQLDPNLVDQFIASVFPAKKAAFLRPHGSWWHKSDETRMAVVHADSGAMAAYYTTTPTTVEYEGNRVDTLWWIDLIVHPDFRRRGLQTLMDTTVRTSPGLKLGFPNQPHSVILERHGWKIRSDAHKFLLPLNPRRARSVRLATGRKGAILKTAATLLTPLAALYKGRLKRYQSKNTRVLPHPDPALLNDIFERTKRADLMTTTRSAEHIQWRYGQTPNPEQLTTYVAGAENRPTHYAITRRVNFRGVEAVRIIDLFGDFADGAALRDLLLTISRDAVADGADQITLMASRLSLPTLQSVMKRCGFLLTVPVYFCWHSFDENQSNNIANIPSYWTLADSDNDEQH